MQATTIDEVLQLLDEIILKARTEPNRLGYFAALYRRITAAVKEGMVNHMFQDEKLVEQFDVVFANFYFEALTAYQQGQPLSEPWRITFHAAESWQPGLVQHILAGMTAHVYLDLGVAAATVCPGDRIHRLKPDYDKINEVLDMIGTRAMTKGGKQMKVMEFFGTLITRLGKSFSNIDALGVQHTREKIWQTAERLAYFDEATRNAEILSMQKNVAKSVSRIVKPFLPLRAVLILSRLINRKRIPQMIDAILNF